MKKRLAAMLIAAMAAFAASAVDCITDVMLIGGSKTEVNDRKSSYAEQGWKVINQDLNAGCGSDSDYIYLLVKSADIASVSNGSFVTDFHIKTNSVTDAVSHAGRVYHLVPYDGGSHFMDRQGDLNSNAGGATIHLYCTKSAFPDNRAVAVVTFNDTQSGAVGAEGGTTGYDLNKGCGVDTDDIYMHVSTVTGLFDVTDVVARQRWPWNGLVDITCTVSGVAASAGGSDFAVAAVMQDSSVKSATHFWVMRDGKKSATRDVSSNGVYRLLWDAEADLGTGGIHSNVVVRVTAKGKGHVKVQLWKDGPYWATTNVGAERPEDFGHYFWWGGTIGYRQENEHWVASNDSSSTFSFEKKNTPTCEKDPATLQSKGWITADGVLAPENDTAHVHWGGSWRMPTKQEIDDLLSKCEVQATTQNGVQGWTITGKGAYASASIFLPGAGYGYQNLYYNTTPGPRCCYWSSVPRSDGNTVFVLDSLLTGCPLSTYSYRFYGHTVRPIQGFTE